jgi:TonB family protein
MPATDSQLDTESATRLVIRIKLTAQDPPQPAARPRFSRTAVLLTLGVVAVLLWLGIGILRPDPPSPPAVTERPSSKPATEPAVASSAATEAKSLELEARQQPDAPPSSIDEAIPDVPRRALDTIRGTVRVSVRVGIDKQGRVVDVAAEDRGPSRYFERLSLEAAKKWTFTPARSDERREMLVKFNFTRDGATAQASPLNQAR